MIDPDKLETARAILMQSMAASPFAVAQRGQLMEGVVAMTDALHEALEATQKPEPPDTGHPAEVALEQLLNLLADHHDKKLVKWVVANAKLRENGELVTYLGAERE